MKKKTIRIEDELSDKLDGLNINLSDYCRKFFSYITRSKRINLAVILASGDCYEYKRFKYMIDENYIHFDGFKIYYSTSDNLYFCYGNLAMNIGWHPVNYEYIIRNNFDNFFKLCKFANNQ